MKKVLLTTAICLVGAASMMAQGRVNFNNTSGSAIKISNPTINGGVPVTLGTGSTAAFGIGPASVEVRLFAGLTSDSLSPVQIGTAANLPFVLNTSSGIASAQGTFAGGSNLGLTGFDGSAPVFLQMTLTSVNGLYGGVSPIIQANLATGLATATFLFSSVAATPNTWNSASEFTAMPGKNLLGLNPTAVPEPASMALAGLGAASLLLFRRRK